MSKCAAVNFSLSRNPVRLHTKVGLVMLRARLRGAVILGKIAFFLTQASLLEFLMVLSRFPHERRQAARARNISKHSRSLLRSARLFPSFHHLEKLREIPGGALIVANHLSFWDILVLSSQIPCLYVTSIEVRETPLLGRLAVLGGCVFVERRSRDRIDSEIEQIRSELKQGKKVVLFRKERVATDRRFFHLSDHSLELRFRQAFLFCHL